MQSALLFGLYHTKEILTIPFQCAIVFFQTAGIIGRKITLRTTGEPIWAFLALSCCIWFGSGGEGENYFHLDCKWDWSHVYSKLVEGEQNSVDNDKEYSQKKPQATFNN